MKLLVDTSVWIDHFHAAESDLRDALLTGQVCTHTSIIGELACGSLARRSEVISNLALLPRLPEVGLEETLQLIELHKLWGRGLSWVDIQILASCRLANARLWTRDRRLREAAELLSLKPLTK